MEINPIIVIETNPENKTIATHAFSCDTEGATEAQARFEQIIRDYGVEPTETDINVGKWESEDGWCVWLVNYQPYL